MAFTERTFALKGMHCATCARAVEQALLKVPGVKSARLSAASETAAVRFEEERVSFEELAQVAANEGYRALAVESENEEKRQKLEKKRELAGLGRKAAVSLVLGALILWGNMPLFSGTAPAFLRNVFIQWALATPAVIWAGSIFLQGFSVALSHRTATMDMLVAIGAGAAYLYSVSVAVFRGWFIAYGFSPEPYFDAAAIVIGLVILGRLFEARARAGGNGAIGKLLELAPKTARLVRERGEEDAPIDVLRAGDLVRVRPGEKIPADGLVIEGESAVDESVVTGESTLRDKNAGDKVIGGTINKTGTFTLRATKVGGETLLAGIIKSVSAAQASRAPSGRMADRVAAAFVPDVLICAAATFVMWFALGPEPALPLALLNSIAVLVIACPCAAGLAMPAALMAGAGRGAKAGVLIKDAESFETLEKVQVVLFDKTGTLSKGAPEVADVLAFNGAEENDIVHIAASLEIGSEHSLADALVEEAKKRKLRPKKLLGFRSLPGYGVQGSIGGKIVTLGNRRLMDKEKVRYREFEKRVAALEAAGKAVIFLAAEEVLYGLIAFADRPKETAARAIALLKKARIETVLLTGDSRRAAEAFAAELGISRVLAEVLPADKESEVRRIQAEGKVTAMVGGGANNAPALAAADVGIATGSRAGIAAESAGMALLHGDLRSVPAAIALAKKTMRTARQNLFWAFGYNVALIPVAMGILYPFSRTLLNPTLAVAAIALSFASVALNSLFLRSASLPLAD